MNLGFSHACRGGFRHRESTARSLAGAAGRSQKKSKLRDFSRHRTRIVAPGLARETDETPNPLHLSSPTMSARSYPASGAPARTARNLLARFASLRANSVFSIASPHFPFSILACLTSLSHATSKFPLPLHSNPLIPKSPQRTPLISPPSLLNSWPRGSYV
jgi:hypothetical protein